MYAYEDMVRALGRSSASSVGETVLKFLEQHIYTNPEQWYQWIKYPEIRTLPVHDQILEIQPLHSF